MSDTPRTDKATCYITDVFGTQFETTNPAIARQLERELAAVTTERDSMVARFRDEINQRQETQRANAIVDAAILSASQQEARRLREAIESQLSVNKEVNKLRVGNFYLPETMDGFLANWTDEHI